MKLTLYLNDYETERVFSYLRWIFLLISAIMFFYPPIDEILQFHDQSFSYLFTLGLIYMASAHIILYKMDSSHSMFPILIKAGIVFDYIALMWLLLLSGGTDSMLFPISYLLVMHATIYWRTKGAFIASFTTSLGYLIIFLNEEVVNEKLWFIFGINLIFLWIIGLFGSLIVLRERKHFKNAEIFHELVVTDYLTGLYNHRHFQEHLLHLTQTNTPFILIMGDIDHFKPINDRYGHLVGDDVLRRLGKLFAGMSLDFEGQAFRYGGEEFTFLLPDIQEARLEAFFNELYKKMNKLTFTGDAWSVTMSFGSVSFKPGQTADQILSIVDNLLYKAKEKGKNCACNESGVCYQNPDSRNLAIS